MDDERRAFFHTSLVCLNGHILEDRIDTHPEMESAYCPRCGESTITTCPNCKTQIRGDYEIEGICNMVNEEPPPNYCHACGNPYPWTDRYREVAKAMAEDVKGLSRKERQLLKQNIDDLIDNTVEAELAATQFNRLIAKSKMAGQPLREFMIQVSAETIKRMLSP